MPWGAAPRRAAPGPAALAFPGNVLEIQLLRPYSGSIESETGARQSVLLTSPPGDPELHSSLRTTLVGKRDSSLGFHPLPLVSFFKVCVQTTP